MQAVQSQFSALSEYSAVYSSVAANDNWPHRSWFPVSCVFTGLTSSVRLWSQSQYIHDKLWYGLECQCIVVFLPWLKHQGHYKVTFYPHDAMLARIFATATCLSVTSRYCVNTKKASVMISSPSGSPTILVWQISSQNSKGSSERGPQRRVGWENSATF